jgi:hypothetical protein
MESTPDRDSPRSGGPWSNWRRWAILLGILILFAVVFDVLERWVTPQERPRAGVASDPDVPLEPIRPEVTKVGDDGVRVELEGGNRMTIRLDDETKADRFIACIEEGLASSTALTEGEAGQPPTSDGMIARRVRSNQVWNEVIRVYNGCMATVADIPIPPPSGP